MQNRLLICAGLFIAAGTAAAQGVQYGTAGADGTKGIDYEARTGVAYTDNVDRAPAGAERSSSAAFVGLQLDGQRPEGRLRYDLGADISYYEYFAEDVDSQVFGWARLLGSYDLFPENFAWNAGFAYEQLRGDLLRPPAPGNLEDQITFSTGPTLTAHFSNVVQLQVDGLYSHTGYSDRSPDNETISGRALLARRANPRSLLGLGVSYDEVTYDSGTPSSALDFDRSEAFGRMELEGVRTDLQLELGYAKVSGTLVDEDGVVARVQFRRRITPSVTLFLTGLREYPTAQGVVPGGITPQPDPDPVGGAYDTSLTTSVPRLETTLQGGLRFERTRSDGEIVYTGHKEQSLLGGNATRRTDELRGRLGRQFTPGARGSLYAAYSEEDYSLAAYKFKDALVGGQFDMSIGRALGVGLYVDYRDRNGDAAADDYSELSGGIYLRYRGSGNRTGSTNTGTR